MAKVDIPFPSVEAAIDELTGFAKRFIFPLEEKDYARLLRESVESTWLKSLARKQLGYFEAYVNWASTNIPKMAKSARYVINQEQYDILVRRTGADLLRAWHESVSRRGGKLSFGAALKIVDMLFMAIDGSKSCRYDRVQRFLHVPLDACTLKPLRLIVDELLDIDCAIEIPAKIPSGFVATEEHYVLLQRAISVLSNRARIAPILYAHWCMKEKT